MSSEPRDDAAVQRRDFIKQSVATAGALGAVVAADGPLAAALGAAGEDGAGQSQAAQRRRYNGEYAGDTLARVAFPMGGIGAGMICLEGTGALSHFSIRNKPEVFNEPLVFAAVCVKGRASVARVLEGPVPPWKLFGPAGTGNGASGKSYGLPRFARAAFKTRFPFGRVTLSDPAVPLGVEITGWSPFEPNDADAASLPVAGLEYRFTNIGASRVDAVFSFNARNFMAAAGERNGVRKTPRGFVLFEQGSEKKPWEAGAFAAAVTDAGVKVNPAWFRGGWWDPLTMAWNDIQSGAVVRPAGGDRRVARRRERASSCRSTLAPGESRTITLQLAWYVGATDQRVGTDPQPLAVPDQHTFTPWYAGRFAGIDEVAAHWAEALRRAAARVRPVHRLLLRHDAAGRSRRGGGGQPDDPQVADVPAPGRRPAVGLGGLQRRQRLLPRLVHARVELRPGPAAPVPGAGADAARDRVRRVAGRRGPPDVPRGAARSGRSSTTSTPPPTASWAAS